MASLRDAAGQRRSVEEDSSVTGFRLSCPDCEFSSVVTGGWEDALDVAEDHAAGCRSLPAGSVVTVRRIPDGRGRQLAARGD